MKHGERFDLSSYETVKERKSRFYIDHPDGRIVVDPIEVNEDRAFFRASIFLSSDDQQNNRPKSTGHAHEIRDKELKTNKYGKEYESVNYTSWVENCEESAIGRALDNAGYSGNGKPSREEMKAVTKNSIAISKTDTSNFQIQKTTNEPTGLIPECCGKPMMISKYIDKEFGHEPFYCLKCKSKQPRIMEGVN